MGRPRRRLRQAAGEEQAELAGQDRSGRRLGPRADHRDRHGRAAAARRATPTSTSCPAASGAASRCAGCCCRTRPAAARRADQPPRRRVGRVARALPAGLPGHGRRDHPRSLLPRQRRQVDPRARPRRGHPVRGQLLAPGSSRSRSACASEEKADSGRQRTLAARARVGAHGAQGAPGQGQGAARPPTRSCWPRPRTPTGARTGSRSSIPPGPRLGDVVDRGRGPDQGLRRPPADRRPDLHPAAGPASSA